MMHLSKRPVGLLTLLQGLTGAVMLGGTCLAAWLGYIGVLGLVLVWGAGIGALLFVAGALLTVAIVSVCCYVALVSFLKVLQRMKTGTAFTPRNCDALGTMAACCGIAAAALFVIMGYWTLNIVAGELIGSGMKGLIRLLSLSDLIAALMIWPFGFGVAALLIQGVRLLMIRAMRLEREQEFVV